MIHKPSTRSPITRSLDITVLESRLLFSVTGVAEMALVPDAAPTEIDVPLHGAPLQMPHAALAEQVPNATSASRSEVLDEADPAPRINVSDESPVRGDFNHDGLVDAADVNMMGKMLQIAEHNSEFDLDRDGAISQSDLDVLIHDVLKTEYGDTNLDGKVDKADADVILDHLFQQTSGWQNGDMNFDGMVDGSDFIIWNAHKSQLQPRPHVVQTTSADQPASEIPGHLPATPVTPASDVTAAESTEKIDSTRYSTPPADVHAKQLRADDAEMTPSAFEFRKLSTKYRLHGDFVPVPVLMVNPNGPLAEPQGPVAVSPAAELEAGTHDHHEWNEDQSEYLNDASSHTSDYTHSLWTASREFHPSHRRSVDLSLYTQKLRRGARV